MRQNFEICIEISWEFLSYHWQYCSNLRVLPTVCWLSIHFRGIPWGVGSYFRGPPMGKRLGKTLK